jgi:hypothetical protein
MYVKLFLFFVFDDLHQSASLTWSDRTRLSFGAANGCKAFLNLLCRDPR